MTLEEITKEIQYIEGIKDDDEIAHSTEDWLRNKFIKAISVGFYSDWNYLQECALEILKTEDIDFARWHA